MSYQVLARKWRPKIFREMVGQEHVLRALINALDHGRLHHAYLFTGTRGVGKTTIARILAKCLNCEVGVSSEPCGSCSACVEIADGRFIAVDSDQRLAFVMREGRARAFLTSGGASLNERASFWRQPSLLLTLTALAAAAAVATFVGIALRNRREFRENQVQSRAALIQTPKPLTGDKAEWLQRLKLRIQGVLQVKESKYIMLHAPRSALKAITALLPGSESPTIVPLDGTSDKVAVHAVCRENVFWETLESLKSAGASAILVLPVEKMLA